MEVPKFFEDRIQQIRKINRRKFLRDSVGIATNIGGYLLSISAGSRLSSELSVVGKTAKEQYPIPEEPVDELTLFNTLGNRMIYIAPHLPDMKWHFGSIALGTSLSAGSDVILGRPFSRRRVFQKIGRTAGLVVGAAALSGK
jgi:hypothetical protein